jgi:hypothetical protein
MIRLEKTLCIIFFVTSFLTVVSIASATVMNFPVHAVEEVRLNLVVEDHVVMKFTVVGAWNDNTLDFWLAYPNGTVKLAFNNIGNVDYSFVCDKDGEYVLHFSNPSPTVDKQVSLDYEVQHYILGMPQMLFLTIIIVGVCVAAVGVFILMGKPR